MSGALVSVPDPSPGVPAIEADAPLPSRDEVRARLAEHTARVKEAEAKRKRLLGLVRGAKLRVGLLEAEAEGMGLEALTANLGIAMADFVMMEVINGNLPIRDAAQAAQVAKIGVEIHKATSGTGEPDKAEMTPEERAEYRRNLVAGVKTLASALRERAEAADAGGVTEGEVDALR